MNQVDDEDIAIHLLQSDKEDQTLNSLETKNFGSSILTLEEALETAQVNQESKSYLLKQSFKAGDEGLGRVIKFRKTVVMIDGEERIIVMIRDFSDSVNAEKMKLKQKEDNTKLEMINQELT